MQIRRMRVRAASSATREPFIRGGLTLASWVPHARRTTPATWPNCLLLVMETSSYPFFLGRLS